MRTPDVPIRDPGAPPSFTDPGAPSLTHLDEQGRARMVDVAEKPFSARTARAQARLRMRRDVWEQMRAGRLPKGDALAVARVAGIMAAKETARLIPLCHPIPLSSVEVLIEEEDADGPAPSAPMPAGEERVVIRIEVTARTVAQTGVEMEALTAACVAALTLYDMAKALDRAMVIEDVALLEKTGGTRGDFRRHAHGDEQGSAHGGEGARAPSP